MLIAILYIGLAALFAFWVYQVTEEYSQAFLCLFVSLLLTPIAGLFDLLVVYFVRKDTEKRDRRR